METKRSVTHPASPKKRSSLAGAASTASRYEYSAWRCALRTSSVLRSFHTPLSRSSQWVDNQASDQQRAQPTSGRTASRIAALTPTTRSTSPPAMKSIEISSGGPIMPRSKSRAIVRSVVSSAALEMGDARRGDTDRDEPVVQVRGHASAEVRGDHLMKWLRDQQQAERHADHHQRADHRDVCRVIALTSQPKATDVTAGSVPRITTSTHQPTA